MSDEPARRTVSAPEAASGTSATTLGTMAAATATTAASATTNSPAPLDRLAIHTATTRPLPIEKAVEAYAAAGVTGITVWRDVLEGRSPSQVGRLIESAGLRTVALCRGGFFANHLEAARRESIAQNRRIIAESRDLGSPIVVLVCGADPKQSLSSSREQIRQAIEALLPDAERAGVTLAIEPLHPMYAAERSAVNTMAQANALCESIDHPFLAIAVDVYHLWWDPDLEREIARAGKKIAAFHVSDWDSPRDLLNDRRLMGEGCIDIPTIRGWVEAAGFGGAIEVEIFSDDYWAMDQLGYIDRIVASYRSAV